MRCAIYILLSVCFIFKTSNAQSQNKGLYDSILVGAIILEDDTIPHKYLNDVIIIGYVKTFYTKSEWRKERRGMSQDERLRYIVKQTYPYAVMAGYIVHDVDSALKVIRSKEAKALYKKKKEDQLYKRYKKELEEMTIDQAKVLVKLISRQTGKDCYTILKEFKGGFNAAIYQALAVLFDNSLKGNYEPNGRDADIEKIVLEIESKGKYIRTNNS